MQNRVRNPLARDALRVLPQTRDLPDFLDDKLGFLAERAAGAESPPKLRLGWPTHLLVDPDDIDHVLIGNHRAYDKTRRLTGRRGRRVIGDALLTRPGAEHRRRRIALQPLFHRSAVEQIVPLGAEIAVATVDGWSSDRPLDASKELERLVLRMRLRTTFSDADDDELDRLAAAVSARRRFLIHTFASLHPLPQLFPRRLAAGHQAALRTILAAIDRRADSPAQERPPDLISMLTKARDGGQPLSRGDLRNEVLTIALTGAETPAAMLVWALHVLSREPGVQERASAEVERVLARRAPGLDDLGRLPYLRSVIAETLRLYPPTWIVPRVATQPDRLPSGLELRPRAKLYLSQWVSHRDPRNHPDPERFDPERFADGWRGGMSRGAYFPFGGGPHVCIGERIATSEAMLVLAAVLARWRVEPVDDRPVLPEPGQTLAPRGGLTVKVRARSERPAALAGSA